MRQGRSQWVRTLVLIAVLGTICCCILAATQLVPAVLGNHSTPYEDAWTLEMGRDTDIHIDLDAIDLHITTYDGTEAQASFSGFYTAIGQGAEFGLRVSMAGNKLEITEDHPNRGIINLGPWDMTSFTGLLTLRLPREKLGQVYVDCFSGDLTVDGLEAKGMTLASQNGQLSTASLQVEEALRLESFSGKQTHSKLAAGNCAITSSSGGISVSDSEFDALSLENFSGKIDLSHVETKRDTSLENGSGAVQANRLKTGETLRCNTFSGKVSLSESEADTLAVETSSGNVEAQLDEEPASLDITTFSGWVRLTLPSDADFTYRIDTFSGGVEMGYPARSTSGQSTGVVGDGLHSLHIETSSGNISVQPR